MELPGTLSFPGPAKRSTPFSGTGSMPVLILSVYIVFNEVVLQPLTQPRHPQRASVRADFVWPCLGRLGHTEPSIWPNTLLSVSV